MSEYDDLLARVRGGESPVAAAPAVDDYDNLLKEVRGQNTVVAQANLNIASVGNPATESEKAVLARQLKDKLGEDWAVPAVDPVEAKRRLMVAENDHVLQNSPKLARQYLDTGFAAQTFDDVPNLGIVEGAVNAVKSLSGAVSASVWGINAAGYGLARAASENLTSTVSPPSLWLAQQQRNAEATRKDSANFGGDLAQMPIMGPVYQGVQSAYQNMLLMPLAFLRNSAAAAVVPMSMISAGQSYGQARDEYNASPLKSLGFAAAQGTAEAATEMLPMGKFIKDVAVGAPVWKMMRNQLVTENLTEQAATAWQDFNEWAMLNPDKPFQSYLDARPGAALDTLIATTTATLLQTGAVQGAMRSQIRQNRAAQAEQAGQALEYLNTSIGNTELSKRDRGTLQQFLQSAAEHDDGTEQTVRINALAFENTLMQAGVDVGQVLEQLPTAKEQWAVAKEVGGDLVLPLSEVAAQTFGTDVGNALLPHIAVGDEAMSLAEAQDFQKTQAEEFRKQAEVVMAEKARDDVFVQSAQEVEKTIVDQLNAANRFTPDVNRAYSTMMRDFYVTTAARMGITPGELFKQFPLNIVAEGQGALSQNIEQTTTPEFKNWFGDSKVVDAEGKPLVVYHGTDADITEFDVSKQRGGRWGKGFYFASSPERAKHYGKNVIPVYLRINEDGARNPNADGMIIGSNPSDRIYVVQDPTQIKSAIGNRGTFDPNDANILNQGGNASEWDRNSVKASASAAKILENTKARGTSTLDIMRDGKVPKIKGTGTNGRVTVWDAANYLAKRAKGKLLGKTPDQVEKAMIDGLVAEVAYALSQDGHAVGWYDHKITSALNKMSEKYPELATDTQARFYFTVITAITSNGQDVIKNFEFADQVYGSWRGEKGALPSKVDFGGDRVDGIEKGFASVNRLVEMYGWEEAHRIFLTPMPAGEVKKVTGMEVGGESVDTMVYGSMVLGPKIGSFFANLNGKFDSITMDMWFMRTLGRLDGSLSGIDQTLMTKYLAETEALLDTLSNPSEFDNLYGFTKEKIQKDIEKYRTLSPENAADGAYFKKSLPNLYGYIWARYRDYANGVTSYVVDEEGKSKQYKKEGKKSPEKKSFAYRVPANYNAKHIYEMVNNIVEDPGSGGHRNWLRSIVLGAQAKLKKAGIDLTNADFQAVIWYYEKDLFNKLGATNERAEPADYEVAAERVISAWRTGLGSASGTGRLGPADGAQDTRGVGQNADGSQGTSGQVFGQAGRLNQPGATDNRGGFSPESLTLILGKKADLSTFLHESAHFYLKVMGDLASRPDAPAQIRQDFEAALKWFGVQGSPDVDATTVWNAMTLEEQRPYHEKWAESFEAYLFSGKAPSIELQTVFSRFKQWMLRVYQSFKEFAAGHPDAEVNPEVAAIFDRLLATDEQIKLAEQARSMMPLFSTEEKSGMTPGEWAAYQELAQEPTDEAKAELNAKGVRDLTWLRRLHARLVKKYNAEAEALRKEEAIAARKEVMSQPLYQAWQFLTGKPLAEVDTALKDYLKAKKKYDADRAVELAAQRKNAEDRLWQDSAEGQKKYRKLASMEKARRSFVSAMDSQIDALRDKLMAPWDQAHPAPVDPRPKKEKRASSEGVDESRDSLFVAIAKLGGISTEQAVSEGWIQKGDKSPQPAFGKRVWSTTGRTLDEMRLALEQYGYVLPFDPDNANWNPRELEEKFGEELGGNPVYSYNADYDFLFGAKEEPAQQENADYGKLDLDTLREMGLPEELVNHLKALRMTGKDGVHPDQVAEQFRFSSGDELVRRLAVAPTPQEAIEALVDQRMLENHGEFASQQAIATAVDAAIHNEARARLVATELRFLAKSKLGAGEKGASVRVLMSAAKSFADQILGRKKIRELSSAPFISAASRAAVNARQAMDGGKHDIAAAELRNQLLNTTAANRAIGAKQEVERAVKYLKKFLHGNSRNSIDVDYMDQIDRLLERFDLKPASNKELDKRTALSKWLTEQEDAGLEPDIPDYLVAEANRTHYRNLTLDEFRGLVDTVRQIEHLGRLKNRLLTTRDKRAFDDVVKTLRASIDANNVKARRADNVERDTWVSRAGGMWKGAMAAHRKIASMVRELDGFKDGGPMWEYFLRSMNEAGDHEATMREQATVKLNEIFQPLLKQGRMGGKGIYIPAIDRSLNRGERLAVALNVGNEGNLQRLMSGYQWSPLQVRAVLATLTKDDLESVQKVWDFFDSYRPQIAAKERRVSGKEPVWIDATPITVKVADGTEVNLRGGYYPIKYDPRQSVKAGQHQDSEDAKAMMRAAYTAATTRRSFTKTRAAEVTGRPLLLSPNVMFTGLTEVIHDLAWHEWLIDANKLIRAVGQDINDIYGAEWVAQFKRGLEDIARGEQAATNTIEKSLNHLRTGATVAGLGWNLTTSLLQPLGLTQSMVRIGPTWVAKGMMTYLSDPVHALENISEKSEFMRVRAKTMMREINEIQNQISGKGKIRTATEATFFVLIQKVQLVADIPTWLGAYEKAMSENTDEGRAVALANQAVIDSQGGGQAKDLALVQRGSPVWKLFTNFYSFFNVALNLGVERTRATNFKKPTEVARLAGDYLLLYSVPAVLGAMLKDALKGGDDDEDKLISKLIAEQISYLLGLFVGVREVTAMAQKLLGVQQFNTAYAGPAGLRFFQELDKLTTQIGQGEWDDALRKALINTTGILFHYPSGQINRTIDGTAALVEGRTSNPLAPVVGAPKN